LGAGSVATNTAVGTSVLQANTTGSNNIAVGYQAGYTFNGATGSNTFLGWATGYLTTGNYNTFVGTRAGYNTTGSGNTFIGVGVNRNGSGWAVTTGGSNTIVGGYDGNYDGLDIRTLSNYAIISDGDGNRLLSTANGYSLALDGGAVPQTGTGITFPATQSASSNANTLDDYEEGTWTPSVGGTATYTTTSGYYTKIGRVVNVQFEVLINSIGTGSGLSISGLPCASGTVGNGQGGSVGYFSGAANSIYFITLRLDQNSTTISIATLIGANTILNTSTSFFTNGTRLLGTMTYMSD
jgi:hypothetical protein